MIFPVFQAMDDYPTPASERQMLFDERRSAKGNGDEICTRMGGKGKASQSPALSNEKGRPSLSRRTAPTFLAAGRQA
ncbi:hypothetical protein [Sphingopyxis sp. 113P3]|uniref:hypothetical protein n=1 Tax=Sphingopyxis sp. (strain 113P3) TaxID=292913 RepID=UPI0006AD0A27|nr:hypothetical protein [Sphingopyxis sp. 113P3]